LPVTVASLAQAGADINSRQASQAEVRVIEAFRRRWAIVKPHIIAGSPFQQR
jgi:hypothetical protein